MSKIIDLNSLIEFYKKAYFPMADSKYSEEIKFYKPNLDSLFQFLIFNILKNYLMSLKKQNIVLKLITILQKL